MMLRLLTFCLIGFAALSAFAGTVPEHPFVNQGGSDSQAEPETTVPGGALDLPRPTAKPEFLLRMSRRDCRSALPRADRARGAKVGADYVPGVDTHGRPVVGADLPDTLAASDVLPEDIDFQLALNPLKFSGNPALAEIFANAATDIGSVTYSLSSGELKVNGIRVDPDTEAQIIDLCRAALGK